MVHKGGEGDQKYPKTGPSGNPPVVYGPHNEQFYTSGHWIYCVYYVRSLGHEHSTTGPCKNWTAGPQSLIKCQLASLFKKNFPPKISSFQK